MLASRRKTSFAPAGFLHNNNRKRSAAKFQIAERVAAAVNQFNYDDITARLYKALVPYAPVGTPLDLVSEKHLNEGNYFLPLQVGDKQFKVPKLPFSMGETAPFSARHQPAFLGEHTDTILSDLGYANEEIAALKAENIVRRSSKMLNIDSAD